MTKPKLHTPDLVAQNIDRLAALFPGCVTEIRDANTGALKRAIDLDQLRQELSGHLVDGPHERYHLNWPGKRDALITANAPVAGTLRPCRDASVHFDTTRNLFIEGDNLDALKLLQEAYLGEVKLIYIDPPYNTGNDFIYKDNFAQGRSSYLLRSKQRDDAGRQLLTNKESNGRFHSDWLSMIFARLRLARNLLRTDGVIFISVDDHEVGNLRRVCDEVFGESNFVATIVWQKRYVSNVTAQWLSDMHDYLLVYARQKEALRFEDWARTEEQKAAYTNRDNDPRGVWRAQDLSASKPYAAGLFEITGPTGLKFSPPPNRYWRCSEPQFNAWRADNRIWWGVNNEARPMLKSFLDESGPGITPHTWWDHGFAGHNKEATLEMKALFDGASPFDTPKPVKLMTRLLELAAGPDSLVLDFFAGSCSMAQAVMQKNAEDGLGRRFIMVQMPEPLAPESPWIGKGYRTIADIGRDRIRRAGARIAREGATHTPDLGFRALRVDTSGMKDVFYTPDALKQEDLPAHADHIKEDRTGDDLLFQVLVAWGVDLSLPVKKQDMEGKCVYFVDGNALAACFDAGVDENLVVEIARHKPRKAVFRDSSYCDDNTKINVVQHFRMLSPETEVRTL